MAGTYGQSNSKVEKNGENDITMINTPAQAEATIEDQEEVQADKKSQVKKNGENKVTVVKDPNAPIYNHPKMTTVQDAMAAKRKREAKK